MGNVPTQALGFCFLMLLAAHAGVGAQTVGLGYPDQPTISMLCNVSRAILASDSGPSLHVVIAEAIETTLLAVLCLVNCSLGHVLA